MDLKSRSFNPDTVEGEFNLVTLWTKFSPRRIKAGILAGIVGGTAMAVFGMIYSAATGGDILLAFKIGALPILGNSALAYGFGSSVLIGAFMLYLLTGFLGAYYAHVTGSNHKWALFGVGLTWGAFSWVFIANLFLPAFQSYREADLSRMVMLFAWMIYGVSLMSVLWFDRE